MLKKLERSWVRSYPCSEPPWPPIYGRGSEQNHGQLSRWVDDNTMSAETYSSTQRPPQQSRTESDSKMLTVSCQTSARAVSVCTPSIHQTSHILKECIWYWIIVVNDPVNLVNLVWTDKEPPNKQPSVWSSFGWKVFFSTASTLKLSRSKQLLPSAILSLQLATWSTNFRCEMIKPRRHHVRQTICMAMQLRLGNKSAIGSMNI